MSFKIQWPQFGADFIASAIQQLNVALNSGKKPDNIAGPIEVINLFMGSRPPQLEILEITELLSERFKGLFKLVYNGDAQIEIKTHVQANPLSTPPVKRILNASQGMVLAHKPFIVPMRMKISRVQMRGVVVLVVDKEKGVTLVFKSDPLESVHVSSTFDNIPNIRKLLQRQIEEQLRMMFQEELPQMIHNLSLMMLKKYADQDGLDSSSNSLPDVSSSFLNQKSPEYNERDHVRIPHHKKWRNNDPVYSHNHYEEDEASQTDGYVLYKTLADGSLRSEQDTGLGRIFGSPRFNKDYTNSENIPAPSNMEPPQHEQRSYIQTQNLHWDSMNNVNGMSTSPSGYMSLGLRHQYFTNNFMTHPPSTHAFISQSEMSAMDPDRDFSHSYSPQVEAFLEGNHNQEYAYSEINADDSVSNVSPALQHPDSRPSSRMQRHHLYPLQHEQHGSQQQEMFDTAKSPISPPSSIHKGQVPDVLWHRPPPDRFVNRPIQSRPSFITSSGPPSSEIYTRQTGINQSTSNSTFMHGNAEAKSPALANVVLKPSDNEVTAHLANLMTLHLTISPNTQQGLANLTFQKAASAAAGAGVAGLMNIANNSSVNGSSSAPSTGNTYRDQSFHPIDDTQTTTFGNGGQVDEYSQYGYRASSVVSSVSAAGNSSFSGMQGPGSIASSSGAGGSRRRKKMRRVVKHMVAVPEALIRESSTMGARGPGAERARSAPPPSAASWKQ